MAMLNKRVPIHIYRLRSCIALLVSNSLNSVTIWGGELTNDLLQLKLQLKKNLAPSFIIEL